MMKRWISVILACLLMFSGCGTNNKTSGTGKKIAVTIFPEYDWIMNILGDNPADMDVTLLLDSGADLHSYQPSAQDIMKIADCDLFVCVGGESDAWVDDALKESVNPNLRVVKLLDVLGTQAKQEETVEGMEAEEEGDIVSDLAVLGESKVHIVFGYEGPDAGQFIPQAEPEVDGRPFEVREVELLRQ